ncbi:hypothetical protein V8E36_009242 [Tilletia maclaganii]
MSNPFLPVKNLTTGRWAPAMSLRRQAQLAKAAHRAGMLDQLPQGPKVDQLRLRIQANKQVAEHEERMARFRQSQGGATVWARLVQDVRERSKQPRSLLPPSAQESPRGQRVELLRVAAQDAALSLARRTFAKRGPYSGRNTNKMFKGHKPERQREQKLKEREERMQAMEGTIREWRQAKAETKRKLQPTLPF